MVHGELWTLKELFVTPNEYIYWSIQIVMYPYMTGLVAGAFVLSSLYHVFGINQLKEMARFALVFSFALLFVAPMPLLLHLHAYTGSYRLPSSSSAGTDYDWPAIQVFPDDRSDTWWYGFGELFGHEAPLSDGLIRANEALYEWLTLGTSLE